MEIFKIFIGGPSDVSEEVDYIIEMISDISVISSAIGMKFETFYWEKDSTPGLASEPQARINMQAQGYDAFIAVLGMRLGSPTASYASGTIEEIERAIAAARTSIFGNNSVAIFFKEITISSNNPNLESLLKIQEFKKTLGPRGIMFREFRDNSDLKNVIYKTLSNIIYNYKNSNKIQSDQLPTSEIATSENIEIIEDLGIMDYENIVSSKFESARILTEIVSAAINALTETTNEKQKEMEIANLLGDRKKVRDLISEVADAMTLAADNIDAHAPHIQVDFTDAISAVRGILEIGSSDLPTQNSEDEKIELFDTMRAMSTSAHNNIETFTEFQRTVFELPRMTKEINIAKKRLVKSTSELINVFDHIEHQIDDFLEFYS